MINERQTVWLLTSGVEFQNREINSALANRMKIRNCLYLFCPISLHRE